MALLMRMFEHEQFGVSLSVFDYSFNLFAFAICRKYAAKLKDRCKQSFIHFIGLKERLP